MPISPAPMLLELPSPPKVGMVSLGCPETQYRSAHICHLLRDLKSAAGRYVAVIPFRLDQIHEESLGRLKARYA